MKNQKTSSASESCSDFIACTIGGLEEITKDEIKEILNINSKTVLPSRTSFKTGIKNIPKLIYNARSMTKVYLLIKQIKFSTKEDIIKNSSIKHEFLNSTFVVRCQRKGVHDFTSMEIEREVGEQILKNNKIKVDIKNPKTTIIIDILNNNCLIGIDLTGILLSKRSYRIKAHAHSTNPIVAFAMIRLSNYDPQQTLLDPFCRSGEIPIEAILYIKNISPNKHNKDRFLINKLIKTSYRESKKDIEPNICASDPLEPNTRVAELNAKIAGIKLKAKRISIEDLDLKLSNIDIIATYPDPKLYEKFLSQAKVMLKKGGTLILLTSMPEAVKHNAKEFKLTKELKIGTGQSILIYKNI